MPTIIDKRAWTPVINRRIPFAKSKGRELFYTIGGKRNPDEGDIEALCREVQEETGVILKKESVSLIGVFEGVADGRADKTIVRLTCYDGKGDGEITPQQEVERIELFSTADMHRTTITGRAVLQHFKDKGLID